MEKINFQNNITPANAETMLQFQDNIEKAINEVLNIVCPIGKVEIFFDNEDHSNYLGFNSSDSDFNTVGKTGGEKGRILTINEMPSHSHIIPSKRSAGDVSTAPGENASAGGTGPWATINNTTTASGGNQPHNNLPPYEVMAFWKRVA